MMLHAAHAYHQGYTRILIRATDTDVLVLAVATASVSTVVKYGWHLDMVIVRYIPAHTIAVKLGVERACGLLFLHAVYRL